MNPCIRLGALSSATDHDHSHWAGRPGATNSGAIPNPQPQSREAGLMNDVTSVPRDHTGETTP